MNVNLIEELNALGMNQVIAFYEECRRLSNNPSPRRMGSPLLVAYFDEKQCLIFNVKNVLKKNIVTFKLDYKNKILSLEKLNGGAFNCETKFFGNMFARPLLWTEYEKLHTLTEKLVNSINETTALIGI